MALMQANNIPGQKKMMSSSVHHGQGHHSHMGHSSDGSCPPLLIRKDGEYHTSRIIEGKDVQTNQNLQPKKKHKKSHKAKEKVEVLIPHMHLDDDSSLRVQKNFICDHCYGAFRSSYHLKRHILTHTGETPRGWRRASTFMCPYACDACDMRFIQRYHLDRHKRVHSGEKPYQCDRCHQNFSRTDRLLRHRRLCTAGVSKEESQYSQDASAHTASWSPLHPSNNRLTV
uniref:Zinc finger protein 740 n=1 Tax=Fundulus heteroclitus TaxID=8078 RepID=A0A3Q2Q594_FUNHE